MFENSLVKKIGSADEVDGFLQNIGAITEGVEFSKGGFCVW